MAKNLTSQILSGLAYLHAKALMHRDLKSENLLLNSQGVLKIADLGSSRKWTPTGKFSPQMVTLRYRYAFQPSPHTACH